MKIAFLNPQGNFDREDRYLTEHPDFGGQLVYVKELALALADLGATVDIITRRIEDPEWAGFEASIDHFDRHQDRVRIVRLEAGGTAFLPKEELWPHLEEMVSGLRRFYGDSLPDAVTTHYADGGWMGVLFGLSTGLPFTFTGHSLGAQKLERLEATPENFDQIDARYRFSQRIAAERQAMRFAGRILTSTRAERFEQYAHPLYAEAVSTGDDSRFDVVPPGINEAIFNADPATDDAEFARRLAAQAGADPGPVVLASSRLDAKKNVAGFVEAWLQDESLRRRSRLALFVRSLDDPEQDIGRLREGEQAVLRPILERLRAAGAMDRVIFVNAGSQRQLATAYRFFARSGSVFVLPSLYEPFGLAPIEAAACGLAVVATRHGGPSEVFDEGAGILVEPTDPGSLAEGMHEALDEHSALSRNAALMVSERYTWHRTAEGYLAAIEGLLERPGPAEPDRRPAGLDAEERIRRWLQG